MKELHVGRGTTYGAMTAFPMWGATSGYRRYMMDGRGLEITEIDGDPDVGTLMVGNIGDRPALVLEGQLFEGGWQHRMALHSCMIGVHQRIPVNVACVEQGRWGGIVRHHSRGRRATPYVRDAVRRGGDVQAEVWNRVAVHTQDVGVPSTDNRLSTSDLNWVRNTAPDANPTGSLVQRLHRAEAERQTWCGLRPLPGQIGVLIGIGGQPYVAEVFDTPMRLRAQLPAMLEAAALDARLAPRVATPSRRAHRFIERLDQVRPAHIEPAGIAKRSRGATEHVDVATLRWQGQDVHSRMTNVRHPLLVA